MFLGLPLYINNTKKLKTLDGSRGTRRKYEYEPEAIQKVHEITLLHLKLYQPVKLDSILNRKQTDYGRHEATNN